MRYIHRIYAPPLGQEWTNQQLLEIFEPELDRLPLDPEEQERLREFLRFQLVGERSRRSLVPWDAGRTSFAGRAAAFEQGVEAALEVLAREIRTDAEAHGVVFDGIIGTTATGNLMPGLSYRLAARLGQHVREETTLLDLANVGCTGSSKALHLARGLAAENGSHPHRHLLVVAVEVPSTLADLRSTRPDVWQGNCTFGDGAAALWLSDDPDAGSEALALEDLRYRQWSAEGLDLIRWEYGQYYHFALRDEKTFDRDVRDYVAGALREAEADWRNEPRWAIHPAGITLLVRLSRRLGIPPEAIQPSVQHYRRHSNMSSASLMHILRDVAASTAAGEAVNLLTMGAGFNVVYGRVRRVR